MLARLLAIRSLPIFFRRYTFVLSVIYASLFCASILVVLLILYFSSFQFLRDQTDRYIDDDVYRIVAGTDWPSTGIVNIRDIKNYLDNRRRIHSKSDPSVYLLVDRNNTFIAGNLHRWPTEFLYLEGNRAEFTSQVYHDDGTIESHPVRAILVSVPNSNFKLLVGRDIMDIQTLKRGFLQLLSWSIVAAVALASGGAYWVSRIATSRLQQVNQLSRKVMGGDLTQRIELTTNGDQFDELADNINQMLERIQQLVEAVRSVSDNVAHDLRTPITRLRNNLEEIARQLTHQSGSEIEDTRTAIEQSISEADSLLQTFEAVLRITRLEGGIYSENFSEVSVSELIEDLGELYDPIASEKSISLMTTVCSPSPIVSVDRDAIAQALTNLLDNALTYTPQGGRIAVVGQFVDRQFEISVSDTGPGIPPEFHDEVMKRFVRLDDDSRTTPGNGLGLCLVSAVVQIHKLKLVLENTHPGLKVRLKNFKVVGSNVSNEADRT